MPKMEFLHHAQVCINMYKKNGTNILTKFQDHVSIDYDGNR
jgi:2-phospho-L-lactate guanylyltransferase (CobY/MobA/RfbA family)